MRTIILYHLPSGKCPVEEFVDTLTDKQFEKVAFVFDLIEQLEIVPKEYFKKLEGTDGLWEIRVQYGRTIFRFLGFLDHHRLVVLNHAFMKKSQKTPQHDIALAEQRKREYFQSKR